jgi:hypothetical protein
VDRHERGDHHLHSGVGAHPAGHDLGAALGDRWWRLDGTPRGPFESSSLGKSDSPALDGLRSGDLVLARHARAQGFGTSLALQDFTWFNHMGVVALEADRVQVYESWATVSKFGSSPDFAGRFQGGVRRTPLVEFLRAYEELAFLRLTDAATGERLVLAARDSLQSGIRFDPYHDPERPELDCSEYVLHLAQLAGLQLDPPRVAATSNASARAVQESLGFHRRPYVVPGGFYDLPGARQVAWLSRHPSAAQALAAREAARLLHAQLGAGGSVGDLVAFDRWRMLRLRDNVSSFLAWTDAYFACHPSLDPGVMQGVLERMLPIFMRGAPRGGVRTPPLVHSATPWHGSGHEESIRCTQATGSSPESTPFESF